MKCIQRLSLCLLMACLLVPFLLAGAEPQPPATKADPAALGSYVGQYELAPGLMLIVRHDKDRLMAQLTGQPSVQVYRQENDTFVYRVVDAKLVFHKDPVTGKVDSVTLHQAGREIPAKKTSDQVPEPAKQRVAIKLDPATYDSYLGQYELAPDTMITIRRAGSRLLAKLTSQPALDLYPESQTTFFSRAVDATVTFHRNGEGQVTHLVLNHSGEQTARKISVQLPEDGFERVDAGGHRLRMSVQGEGQPVVVLEAGLGGGIDAWGAVPSEVAKFSRVISYDRAGLGESDSGPLPRDPRRIATELHAALKNLKVPPPYVLVGHSAGGPFVRVFAKLYPDEVAGMVLVDPTHEEFKPEEDQEGMESIMALLSDGQKAEYEAFDAIREQAAAAWPLPKVPIQLISATKPDAGTSEQKQREWVELHRAWVKKVSGTKHVMAEKSTHNVQLEEPELVVQAIREVVAQSRNEK